MYSKVPNSRTPTLILLLKKLHSLRSYKEPYAYCLNLEFQNFPTFTYFFDNATLI